jgi:hypothetical protein
MEYLTKLRDHVKKYALRYTAGTTLFLSSLFGGFGCAGGPHGIDDTRPISLYSVKDVQNVQDAQKAKSSSGKKKSADQAEEFYERAPQDGTDKQGKRKKVITNIGLKGEAGKYRYVRGRAKVTITPDEIFPGKGWIFILESVGRYGVKEYDEGRDLEFREEMGGMKLGKYFDLRSILKGTKGYLEIGAHAEGTQYTNRADMKNYRLLGNVALGFFSDATGTKFKATIRGGQGRYNLDLSSGNLNERLSRKLVDMQAKQDIVDVLEGTAFAKGRLNHTRTNYLHRADARVTSADLGLGWEGKFLGMDRAFIESLVTYRKERNGYFNGTKTIEEIWGGKLSFGAEPLDDLILKLGMLYDEELRFRVAAEIGLKF